MVGVSAWCDIVEPRLVVLDLQRVIGQDVGIANCTQGTPELTTKLSIRHDVFHKSILLLIHLDRAARARRYGVVGGYQLCDIVLGGMGALVASAAAL
jgi:hypothetical protein